MATESPTNFDPCNDFDTEDESIGYTVAINVLVFFTVWGISSVVDIEEFKQSFRKPPIYAGAAFQFLLMPLIGFITILIFPLENLSAIALLILCASPGGSFSNWWCNLFNADLALSVSMTSLSTVASIAMLPLNIVIYVQVAYENTQNNGDEDDFSVDFTDLGITLGIVISGVILGLLTGAYYPQYQTITNIIGNVAGAGSIILGLFASTDTCDGKAPWEQAFYPLWIATAFPLLIGLTGVMFMTKFLKLTYPQRVAIALETAYQNTSIALAYTLSQGAAGRRAAGVPVIYGGYEAGFFGLFMLTAWKMNWTYAPPSDPIRKVMFDNYQPGGDNHKRLFPGFYTLKEEAEAFNKSVRKSITALGRRLSSVGVDKSQSETPENEERAKTESGDKTDSNNDDEESGAAPLKNEESSKSKPSTLSVS